MRDLLRKSCSKTLQFRKHPKGIRAVSLYSQLHRIISTFRVVVGRHAFSLFNRAGTEGWCKDLGSLLGSDIFQSN